MIVDFQNSSSFSESYIKGFFLQHRASYQFDLNLSIFLMQPL